MILKSRALRNGIMVKHHIFSSLWSSIKQEVHVIISNASWKVGNGQSINLWMDAWCGNSLAETLNIHTSVLIWLPKKVSDIIHNQHWLIPHYLDSLYPTLKNLVLQIDIPVDDVPDSLIWKGTDNGLLCLKDAYEFKRRQYPKLSWGKVIWSKDIQPSRSLLAWRIMLNKIPTDDNLRERGCNLTSMCSLCNSNIETMFHLFFECRFAFGFWCWLATSLDMIIQFQSLEDIWSLCNRAISAQCRIVIKAAIINIMYAVWIARNNARFKNIKPNWNSSLAWIVVNVMLSGNHTNSLASASIRDFTILKAFKVNLNPPKPSFLREVIWQPPPPQWIKCNIGGAFTSSAAACAGLFRNSSADFICGFASRLNTSSAFSAELYGFINAVDFAVSRGWNNLWIESDSELVVKAYKSATEGNHCADGLAKLGLNLNSVLIWNDVPVEIRDSFDSNKHGKPCFRVVHS
ncbi:hypothetical protein TSUD_280370 [Trifolium subterraneum]|uniref:RNase H type-1 domain-containing protein n=1 Tax=Trifolium subterraneum TaxID=3900 RepID=A0A2Z6NMF4_TRISU|nr:hypothetical protein TSUD_280370 [Trifolium subterraneum]